MGPQTARAQRNFGHQATKNSDHEAFACNGSIYKRKLS